MPLEDIVTSDPVAFLDKKGKSDSGHWDPPMLCLVSDYVCNIHRPSQGVVSVLFGDLRTDVVGSSHV